MVQWNKSTDMGTTRLGWWKHFICFDILILNYFVIRCLDLCGLCCMPRWATPATEYMKQARVSQELPEFPWSSTLFTWSWTGHGRKCFSTSTCSVRRRFTFSFFSPSSSRPESRFSKSTSSPEFFSFLMLHGAHSRPRYASRYGD